MPEVTESLSREQEARFVSLTESQKDCARAMFFDARPQDGYWYLLVDGRVFSRNRQAQTTCFYPDCRCPLDAPADPDWCARGLPHRSSHHPEESGRTSHAPKRAEEES